MKDYNKLRKKYHMPKRNQKNKEINPILFIILIYIVSIINTIISIYRLNNTDQLVDKMHIFMTMPYFLIIVALIITYFIILSIKHEYNKKNIIRIIIASLLSLVLIPYFFTKPIAIVYVLVIVVLFIIFIKLPSSSNTKKESKVISSKVEPIVLRYSKNTTFYQKGILIYKKDTTGETSICNADAFNHGDIIIMQGDQKVSSVPKK